VLAAALCHPACQEDYLRKGQQWLLELGLKIPDCQPSLESMVSEILLSAKTGLQ
jgi:hypothetical protein